MFSQKYDSLSYTEDMYDNELSWVLAIYDAVNKNNINKVCDLLQIYPFAYHKDKYYDMCNIFDLLLEFIAVNYSKVESNLNKLQID